MRTPWGRKVVGERRHVKVGVSQALQRAVVLKVLSELVGNLFRQHGREHAPNLWLVSPASAELSYLARLHIYRLESNNPEECSWFRVHQGLTEVCASSHTLPARMQWQCL